jgi:dihydroxyacetone kinase
MAGSIGKKLINDPFDAVDEMLSGFAAAHSELIEMAAPRVIRRRASWAAGHRPDKVGIVVGGGSGHEPAFGGYVGVGLADAAVCGNIFASPPPGAIVTGIEAADTGRGVLLLYGNYTGDALNFDLAAKIAAERGIETRTVRVSDDVASAPFEQRAKRRGIAGDVLVFKAAGAEAERGASLDEVERVARKANGRTRSIGVALGPCWVPGSGRPSFELGDAEMEIGLGLHGEPGIRRGPLAPANEIARLVVASIIEDFAAAGTPRPSDIALLVNGLGATAVLDLYVFYRDVREEFEAGGYPVATSYVGQFITSLEMAGASVTAMELDNEMRDLLDAPALAPAFVR